MSHANDEVHDLRLESDEHGERISALNHDGQEVAGAYRPRGLNDWRVYIAHNVTDTLGLSHAPKAHVGSRSDAVRWVNLMRLLAS